MALENTGLDRSVRKNRWIRISTIPSQTDKASLKYLYIGDNTTIAHHLSNQFQSGDAAVDFAEAIQRFLGVGVGTRGNLYDVVFIDLPYQKSELKSFFSFLKRYRLLGMVLIYNGVGLSRTCIKYIKKLRMVDDIRDIYAKAVNYTATISFLQRCKRAHKLRHLRALKNQARRFSVIRCMSYLLKRALDIIIAIAALIILFPVLVIIAIIIKMESKGPVFYSSPRAGKGYKIFKFHKFRTMLANAEQEIQKLSHLNQYADNNGQAVFYKIQNDPRVTRFGKFLRNTSLDEIPQFINVLNGDMSLVGNRPLPLYEAAALTTNDCVERFTATAGITGLWQVKKRGKAEMSDHERISLDITYARKENLFYDLWIMLCTPVALMQKSDV